MLSLLWLFYFPLLFLPNFGRQGNTAYGVLELSDFLIGPYLVLVFLASRQRGKLSMERVLPMMIAFTLWAVISTVSIGVRYNYGNNSAPMTGGLLKLGKLAIYTVAGILTSRALVNERARRLFPWSVLAAGVVMGAALVLLPEGSSQTFDTTGVLAGYKANNIINAGIAIVLCYTAGVWLTGQGTAVWRKAAVVGCVIMIIGLLLSSRQGGHGRGGWVATVAGFAYIFYKRGLRKEMIFGVAGLLTVLGVAYTTVPEFRSVLMQTLNPDEEYVQTYTAGVGGLDDGGRAVTWANELPKLMDSPILGTGFFHRGGESPLWATGSHNFFIQMFLETGLVGGMLMLGVFWAMWKEAGAREAKRAGQMLPVRAALVAAFVGGLSGEYFYGGIVVLMLFAVFAPVGSLRAASSVRRALARPARAAA